MHRLQVAGLRKNDALSAGQGSPVRCAMASLGQIGAIKERPLSTMGAHLATGPVGLSIQACPTDTESYDGWPGWSMVRNEPHGHAGNPHPVPTRAYIGGL